MNHLNSCLLEGNVVKEPEVKAVGKSGSELVIFRIASNRYWKSKDAPVESEWKVDPTYLDIYAWGNIGQRCMDLLKKGTEVRVVGRLRVSTWKGKESEKEYTSVGITAQHLEFKVRYKEKDQMDEDVMLNVEGGDDEQLGEPLVIYQ